MDVCYWPDPHRAMDLFVAWARVAKLDHVVPSPGTARRGFLFGLAHAPKLPTLFRYWPHSYLGRFGQGAFGDCDLGHGFSGRPLYAQMKPAD